MQGTTIEAAARLPVRSAFAWPLATAALGAMQAFAAHDRQGGAASAVVWAVLTAFALGSWLGLLHALVAAALARRTVWSRWTAWVQTRAPAPSVLAAATVLALAVELTAWWGIDLVYALARAHPLDYDAVGRQIWRGAAALTLPVLAAVLFVGVRGLETRLRAHEVRAKWVARVGASSAFVLAAWHLSSGPFFVYFGSTVAVALLVGGAVLAAAWLPASIPLHRPAALRTSVAWVALVLVGAWGLRDVGVRALLLHEAPLFAEVHALATGWADGDGDGDLPPWLGGTDCDGTDPAISGAAKELPGNGIDDNCHAGDASSRPAAEPLTPTAERARPPIVLVTIDTVRADHLELYGYPRETMPALARLGARGVVFERAYSPGNHTFFSVTALLAGQSIERMLVPGDAAVPHLGYSRWLPDLLGRLGYHRVSIDPPLVLDGKMRPEELRFDEVDLGPFDTVGDNRGAKSRQVADSAIRWLEAWQGDAPVFLWVHFIDPHAVHESPERFATHTESDAYDNELSWVDLHLGRVLAAVDRTLGSEAHVIVTSDHGEQLGEAGGWGHGFSLREAEVRVPLVVVAPGLSPRRVGTPVSGLRIPATVMHWLGFSPEGWPEAPSLLLDPEGDPPPVVVENPAFLWNARRMEAALVDMPFKLVHSRTTNTTLLYDLERDPHERDDLAGTEPEIRERMLAKLLDLLEHAG